MFKLILLLLEIKATELGLSSIDGISNTTKQDYLTGSEVCYFIHLPPVLVYLEHKVHLKQSFD